MKVPKLTNPAFHAHKPVMEWARHRRTRSDRVNSGGLALVLLGTIPVTGCITLEAPDKPIVIELNINITQEVIYRLAEDAGNTIEENADIF